MYFDDQMYSKCILNFQNILANIDGLVSTDTDNNPYMDGQKLPVAAKKGHFWNFEKDNDSYRKFLLLLLNFHFETFQLPSSANILKKRAVSTIIKMFEPSYDFENMLTKHLSSVTKLSNIQTENTYNIWSAKLCNSNTDHQKIKSQLVHYLFL